MKFKINYVCLEIRYVDAYNNSICLMKCSYLDLLSKCVYNLIVYVVRKIRNI